MVRSHCLRPAVYKLMSPCNAKALQRGFTSHIKPKADHQNRPRQLRIFSFAKRHFSRDFSDLLV